MFGVCFLLLSQDFRVNDDTGTDPAETQNAPHVAVAKDSSWLVYFGDYRNFTTYVEVFGKRYNPSGAANGNQFVLSVSLGSDIDCWPKDGVAGADTSFMVMWLDDPAELTGRFVYPSDTSPAFYIQDTGTSNAYVRGGRESVAGDRWGDAPWVVSLVFEDDPRAPHQDQVWFKRYARSGALVDSGRVDTTGAVQGSYAACATDSAGSRFAVFWKNGNNLFAGLFDGNNNPPTRLATLWVNSDTPNFYAGGAQAAMDANGDLFVVWVDSRSGVQSVYLRAYDRNGGDLFGPMRVSDGTQKTSRSSIDADRQGNLTVVWAESLTVFNAWHIMAVDFRNCEGTYVWGPVYRVDEAPDNVNCTNPDVALRDRDSSLFFVWQDGRNLSSQGWDIYGKIAKNTADCGLGLREEVLPDFPGVKGPVPRGFTLEIYDALGRLRSLETRRYDLRALGLGVYFLVIRSRNGKARLWARQAIF